MNVLPRLYVWVLFHVSSYRRPYDFSTTLVKPSKPNRLVRWFDVIWLPYDCILQSNRRLSHTIHFAKDAQTHFSSNYVRNEIVIAEWTLRWLRHAEQLHFVSRRAYYLFFNICIKTCFLMCIWASAFAVGDRALVVCTPADGDVTN